MTAPRFQVFIWYIERIIQNFEVGIGQHFHFDQNYKTNYGNLK